MTDIYSLFRELTSTDNPLVKDVRSLLGSTSAAKKVRDTKLITAIEGIHLLQAWAQSRSGYHEFRAILTTRTGLSHPEIIDLLSQFAQDQRGYAHIDFVLIDENIWDSLSGLKNAPHLLALVKIPDSYELKNHDQDIVVLDAIQDAGNVGTILRTCLAAGFKNIIALKGTAGLWTPKVLRAAMGAHPFMQLAEGISATDFVAECLTPIISARLDNSTSLYELKNQLKQPVAWVFGNEGQGVSSIIAENSIGANIPIDSEIESLNVSTAAAICLFETRRIRSWC